MWLAVVLVCANQAASSCQVIANSKKLHMTEAVCSKDAGKMAVYLINRGAIAVPSCVLVGSNT